MTLWQRRRGKATRPHEDIRVQVLEDRGGGESCLIPAMETPGRVFFGPVSRPPAPPPGYRSPRYRPGIIPHNCNPIRRHRKVCIQNYVRPHKPAVRPQRAALAIL